MTTFERVRKIIAEVLEIPLDSITPESSMALLPPRKEAPPTITSESSFIDDLSADSLTTIELTIAFEEEFGMEMDESKIEVSPKLQSRKGMTVQEMVDFIDRHRKQ